MNSNADLHLSLAGLGSEPHIVFDRTLLEFEPVLPYSVGSVAEVTVTNPTPHPVEFYSLDFDKQYIQEEEVACTIIYGYQGVFLGGTHFGRLYKQKNCNLALNTIRGRKKPKK